MVDLFAHLDQGLDRIEGLGGGRIEVDDDVDVSALGDILDVLEGGIGVHAEAEPHVRGHQEDAVSAGFLRLFRHLDGLDGVLAVDTGDDGHHIAALFGADLGDSLALGAAQAGDLAGVAVADEAFDSLAVEGLDPAQVLAELFLVDGEVVVEGDGNCREDSLEGLNFSHDHNLLFLFFYFVSAGYRIVGLNLS